MSKIEAKEYVGRVEAFRKSLAKEEMDAFVATSLPAMRYLCGYSGREEAALVLTPSDLILIVSKLHVEKEKRFTFGTMVVEKEETLSSTIASVFHDEFPQVVGFEGKDMSVSKLNDIREEYDDSQYKTADLVLESLREVKSMNELAAIKESVACVEMAFMKTMRNAPVNMSTEKDVASQLDYQMKMCGADMISFPVRVLYGESCGTPHMMPRNKMAVSGESVMFDWGAVVDGYHSDISRTGFVGEPVEWWKRVYEGVTDALAVMELEMKPGVGASDIYRAAEKALRRDLGDIIESQGGSYGLNFGHGIGVEEHESPHISAKSKDIIRAGNVICMEPSLYFFGKGCVHIEDMYLVTEKGVERISTLTRKMVF